MERIDLLVLAGDVADALEAHGLVACGRRRDGVTTIDFWGPSGSRFRLRLTGEETRVDALVSACLEQVGRAAPPRDALS